jgi:hypothetical protein
MVTKCTRRENTKNKKRAKKSRRNKNKIAKSTRAKLTNDRPLFYNARLKDRLERQKDYHDALKRFNTRPLFSKAGLMDWLEKQKTYGSAFWGAAELVAFDQIAERASGSFADELERAPGYSTVERSTLGNA